MSNDPDANYASLFALCDEMSEGHSAVIDRRQLCEWLSAMSLLRAEVERLTRERDDARDDARAWEAVAHSNGAAAQSHQEARFKAEKQRDACLTSCAAYRRTIDAEAERDRLREALEETLDWCEQGRASGDCGFWDWEPDSFYVRARAALKGEA